MIGAAIVGPVVVFAVSAGFARAMMWAEGSARPGEDLAALRRMAGRAAGLLVRRAPQGWPEREERPR